MPLNAQRRSIRRELEVRNRQIAAVHDITTVLSTTLDFDERMKHILTVSMQAVDAVAGTIYRHRADDHTLVFQYVIGEKAAELTGQSIPDTTGVVGQVFHTGIAELTNNAAEQAEHRKDITGDFVTERIITAPIQYQVGKPVGVLQLLNKRSGAFDHHDLEVIEIIAMIAASSLENAQLAREAQLAAIARAVGDLSHDIKNKVTPIQMAVETLRPSIESMLADLDEMCAKNGPALKQSVDQACGYFRQDYVECFDIIIDQVHEVQEHTKLIADTLKGGVSEPKMEPLELTPVIVRQVDKLDPIARRHGVTLVRLLKDVPLFRFDRFRVESAVYNLINNAIPETPSGGTITIRTASEVEGEFPNGRYALIEVHDTGKGISRDKLVEILNGNATSTKPGGTGLGTRIVRKSVADHHGVFEGTSGDGIGTTFRIKLPLISP